MKNTDRDTESIRNQSELYADELPEDELLGALFAGSELKKAVETHRRYVTDQIPETEGSMRIYEYEMIFPCDCGYIICQQYGVRDIVWQHSEKSGADTVAYDRNRGMNKGIAVLLEQKRMRNADTETALKAIRQNGYQDTAEICRELENIVGKKIITDAYRAGKVTALEHCIDRLCGKGSFGRLSSYIDTATYDPNPIHRRDAMAEAHELLAGMYRSK